MDHAIASFKSVSRHLWGFISISALACFLIYWFYGGIIAFTLLSIALAGYLYQAQDLIVYQPTVPKRSRLFVPRPSFTLTYEDVRFPTKDNMVLHMYFIKQKSDSHTVPTLVYFHGNAGNMGHRLKNTKELFFKLNINILMVEYRGYGFSEGSPSESGVYMDALAALDFLYLRKDINHKKIIIFGRSLGGAVAIDLVARPECAAKVWCCIVENTFTDIPELVTSIVKCRIFRYLPLIMFKNKFLSSQKVRHLSTPILFICGLSDSLVPPRMARCLHNLCQSSHKRLVQLEGGTHNDTWSCEGYYSILLDFLNNVPENINSNCFGSDVQIV